MTLTKVEKRSIIIISFLLLLPLAFILDDSIVNLFTKIRFEPLTHIMSLLGNVTEWSILLLIVVAIIILTEKKHIPNYLLSFVIAMGITTGLKYLLMVARPETAAVTETGFSFPSGHATAAFVSLPYLNHLHPKLNYLWFVLVMIIALSRLYIGVHYPSDIIAGAMIGLSSAYVAMK